jgi:hypothetical protein
MFKIIKKKKMKFLYCGTTIFNVIVLAFLFIYFAIVHLNLVFTFKHLTVSDVPYYDTGVTYPNIDQRFGIDWWMYLTDYFRFIPIFSMNATIGASLLYVHGYETTNIAVIGILLIWEILKLLVVRIPEWASCANIQVCRNENPADNPPSAFEFTSMLWQWTVFFNVAYIGVLVIYLILAAFIKREQKEYYEELKKKGIKIYDKADDGQMNSILFSEFNKFAERAKHSTIKKLASVASILGK